MLDREELDSAVAAGVISSAQADALVSHYAPDPTHADREEVRFARGFHDVFITIGLAILFAGLFLAFSSLMTEGENRLLTAYVTAAALAWGLAEWLAGRRKLALPSIVLSAMFTWFFAVAATALYGLMSATLVRGSFGYVNELLWPLAALPENETAALVFGLSAFLGGALYYWRFQVPIALTGLLAGILAATAAALESLSPGLVSDNLPTFTLLAGLVAFAVAMAFDSRDLARTTLNTDKAFWLHLLAAPLIMHSVLAMIGTETGSTAEAVTIIAVVLALGFVALVVDRRALLVSGLVYLGIAIFNLLRTSDVEAETGTAAALLILGLFVLTLGSGWTALRRMLLAPFAGSRLFTYVPPIRTQKI